jgi:hypothetical protein
VGKRIQALAQGNQLLWKKARSRQGYRRSDQICPSQRNEALLTTGKLDQDSSG